MKEASIRGSVVAAVLSEFTRRGLDLESAMATYGLAGSVVADRHPNVPLAPYVRMFEDMADRFADPLIGARLGTCLCPKDIGPAGLLMARSESMKAALDRLIRFMDSLQSGAHSALRGGHGLLIWTYRLHDPAVWPRRQDAEFTLSSLIRLMRLSFRADWQPVRVQFEHAAMTKATSAALARLLGCPVAFEAATNSVTLQLETAQAHYRDEDQDLVEVLERHLTDITPSEPHHDSYSDKISALIEIYLGRQSVTIERLAADLAMSPRSLQRRLAEEETSLRKLLRRHRQELAGHFLQGGGAPMGKVAESLGYVDGTTFWRAHRNWTGRSPSKARLRQR